MPSSDITDATATPSHIFEVQSAEIDHATVRGSVINPLGQPYRRPQKSGRQLPNSRSLSALTVYQLLIEIAQFSTDTSSDTPIAVVT